MLLGISWCLQNMSLEYTTCEIINSKVQKLFLDDVNDVHQAFYCLSHQTVQHKNAQVHKIK